MPRVRALAALTPLAALAALLALAALALAPAAAQEPVGVPPGLEFQLQLVDDSDNIVQADSTISVSGRLRLEPGTNLLRIASGALQLSGAHDWEASSRSRLSLDVENLLPAIEAGGEIIAYTDPPTLTTPLGNGNLLRVLAWDGDTIVARAGSGSGPGGTYGDNRIYVFKASTGEQVGRIETPRWHATLHCVYYYPTLGVTCAQTGEHAWGFGRGNDYNTTSSVAVWQEDADTAWLFVGMSTLVMRTFSQDFQHTGGLHIFEIDYSGASVAITQRRLIRVPTRDEMFSKATFQITQGAQNMSRYGAAVAISADGSTLAVGARRMHEVGAVYVYTRPSGGWGASFGWNDGVRVSPVVIPPWGGSSGTGGPADGDARRPFNPQAASTCDAYCRSVSSYVGDVDEYNPGNPDLGNIAQAKFGHYVALSADGSVLAVSAPEKRYSSDRAAGAGSFRGGASLPRHGEVLVFLEPAGGWESVPNYKTETDPDRTEIGYTGDASSFSQASHYGTGPDKRVQAPDWKFSFDWSDTQNHWLGERLALSPDGTTLAASDRHNDAVQMFQVDSPGGWASGPSAPSATLTGAADGGRWGGFDFNSDGSRLALGDPTYSSPAGVSNQGRLLLFRRPADGSWADAAAADATEWLAPTEPTNRRVNNAFYGRSLAWGDTSNALAVGAGESGGFGTQITPVLGPGRFWTLTLSPDCNAAESLTEIDGVTYCHLDLSLGGDSSIVIPAGTPDGAFTISGDVSVVYGEDAEGEPLSVQRRATLEVQIGDVVEVAEVRLERATDDRGTAATADDVLFPDTLAEGETTTLRLQVLNEHGKAAATDSVSLVSVTSSAGELSAEITGSTSTCRGGNGTLSCIIDGSALTAANADKILITLRHAGKPGAAQVSARAISKQGEQAATAQPLTIALTGAPASLSISEPTTGVLGYDTPDAGADVDARDVDNRDVLTLTVTAADKDGAAVRAADRSYSYRITGPDGQLVPASKIAVQWPLLGDSCASTPAAGGGRPTVDSAGVLSVSRIVTSEPASRFSGTITICVWDGTRWRAYEPGVDEDFLIGIGDAVWVVSADELIRAAARTADGQPSIRLNVNAEAANPLASGEYTLEVRQAGLPWVSRTFQLAGAPAEVALSEPSPAPALQREFTVTATVTDTSGAAVPNGTPVHWGDRTIGDETTTLVQTGQQTTTTDGTAEASYLIVSPGTAVVTVTAGGARTGAGGVSGGVSNVIRVAVADPTAAAAQPPSIIEQLSSTTPGAPTSWLGESSVTASALLNALDGVDSILLWQYGRWLTYAVVDGREIPGSYDFVAQPGAVLWLAE